MSTGDCNAASFYMDANGVQQCYLLNCVPFTDCEWTQSSNEEWKGGFMKVVDVETEDDLEEAQNKVGNELTWSIVGRNGNTAESGATTQDMLTDTTAAAAAAPTTQPALAEGSATTAKTAVDVTVAKEGETTEKTAEGTTQNNDGAIPAADDTQWPSAKGGANAGATATGQEDADTGDLVDAEGAPISGVKDADESGSKTHAGVVVVCVIAGVGLLVLGIVFLTKRLQAERDRSIYRPLMDDIHSQGFRESDPLH